MATELRNGLFSQRYPTMAVDAFSASHTCFKLNASRPASSARRLASYRCLAASSALAARAARIDGSRRQYRMVGGDYLLGIRLTSCWPPSLFRFTVPCNGAWASAAVRALPSSSRSFTMFA